MQRTSCFHLLPQPAGARCSPSCHPCSATRSSLHYDPYQNLLCVARGCKMVWLAPPAATPWLSPQPLTHESANHSPADLSQPDLRRFPGLARVAPLLRRFDVAAGDALYIPEGWWHQASYAGAPGWVAC